ncbi:BQ5605_C011g06294 [Microbotryum silenes-dioicae]|uniref:BQ5605_C011g06294 protein n=1 Tax=Microbotryum silenes-dioicae TaxID=796604 RepID=A0A2X0NKW5_9BASI|nr:BQ5605_C011g06294 [Microbotryum silenes-dioicae]
MCSTSHSSFPCTMIAADLAAWRPGKASPLFATHRRSLDTWKTLCVLSPGFSLSL